MDRRRSAQTPATNTSSRMFSNKVNRPSGYSFNQWVGPSLGNAPRSPLGHTSVADHLAKVKTGFSKWGCCTGGLNNRDAFVPPLAGLFSCHAGPSLHLGLNLTRIYLTLNGLRFDGSKALHEQDSE